MSTLLRRLIVTAAAAGAVTVLFAARASAQPFLAAVQSSAAACVEPNTSQCTQGLLHVVNGSTLGIRSLVLWQGRSDVIPLRIVAHPAGAFVYVPQRTTTPTLTQWIDIVDVRTMTKVHTFSVDGTLAAISADGTRLYVTGSDTVRVLDSTTGAVLATAPLPGPQAVAESPNGARLYISNSSIQSTSIAILDAATLAPLGAIPLPTAVNQLEFSADGQHLFALAPNSLVFDVDPAANVIARSIRDFGGPTAPQRLSVGGGRLYVAVSFQSPGVAPGEGIAAIDVATGLFIAKANLVDPYDVEASTDGTRVWALGFGSPRLTTIDGQTVQVISMLPAGSFSGLAAIPPQRAAEIAIDQPAAGAVVQQPFDVSGFAVDPSGLLPGTGVSTVHLWAHPEDGSAPTFIGADYGRPRPDVAANFGPVFTNSGYQITVRGLRPGAYRLVAYGFSLRTGQFSMAHAVSVTVGVSTRIAVDTPQDGRSVAPRFAIAGWALDTAATTGTGVDAVHVWAYPAAGGSPTFAGAATIGGARPDVGAYFGAQFTNAGYQLEISNLAPGTHTLIVYAHSTVTGAFTAEQHVRVTVPARQPLMWIDTPTPNQTVPTTFAVSGWALELNATDTGVDLVHIWATSASGAATFLGTATYGVSRPDIGAWLGPQYSASGFSLVASLPPGTYTLSVYARSTETGTFRQWQIVQVTVQ